MQPGCECRAAAYQGCFNYETSVNNNMLPGNERAQKQSCTFGVHLGNP